MGVELSQWCETIARHPLSFRFRGLEGLHKDVREAAVHDERFMEDYVQTEYDYQLSTLNTELSKGDWTDETLHGEFVEQYVEWLKGQIDGFDCDEIQAEHGDLSLLSALKGADAQGMREKWAEEATSDVQHYWAMIREDDPSYLLEKHPPEAVKSHASGDLIPLDDVYFICPSCGSEPQREEDCKDSFYCGLCGASNAGDMATFFEDVGVERWPFRTKPKAAEVATDPTECKTCHGNGYVDDETGRSPLPCPNPACIDGSVPPEAA